MKSFTKIIGLTLSITLLPLAANAISTPKLPSLPGASAGIQGSAGAGFTDFSVVTPATGFKIDRGTYVALQIERGFDFLQSYFTMTLSQMNASGVANYDFTNATAHYTATDVNFNASLLELSLGFKFKIIDDYWFRPYVEGGGIGSYYQISYSNKDTLNALGSDWKRSDTLMGSGYYGEGGIEVSFTEKFGLKFAARFSDQRSKDLETQAGTKLHFNAETYYFSALMGF